MIAHTIEYSMHTVQKYMEAMLSNVFPEHRIIRQGNLKPGFFFKKNTTVLDE